MAVHKVLDKSNEITAIPLVLETLDKCGQLKGEIVTIDAMGRQKRIADMIHRAGAFHLFNLKGNDTGLLNEVESLFAKGLEMFPDEFEARRYTSRWKKSAGRVERRTITMITLDPFALTWLTKTSDWAGIRSVMLVEREVEHPAGSKEENFTMRRHFISSAAPPPWRMFDVAVEHWMV
jgi:predicted transposase YbfD/YdcC